MWKVGISVSPCTESTRMGYDLRQMNRIVIRLAQYCLNQNMCVVFGHDWREDGVMRAIAEFAGKVGASSRGIEQAEDDEALRMINVVPTYGNSLNKAALDAQYESGGTLKVLTFNEAVETFNIENGGWREIFSATPQEQHARMLTELRVLLTELLDPGCRICIGGKISGYDGNESGVVEEARLALKLKKPLYLLGGFGGATRQLGEYKGHGCMSYWKANNGLSKQQKQELFETTDIERSLRLISNGVEKIRG